MKYLILALISTTCFAISGLEVMQKVEKKSQGYIGSESKMVMTLIDAHGTSVERVLKSKALENIKEGDKSISEFIKPKDIKGTKLLTWTSKSDTNKQWLYLPKFKRIKKINSKNQSGSFMGSEFSYEDIGGQVLDKYDYKLLKETATEYIVQSIPKSKSGYSKMITTIIRKDFSVKNIEYYNRRGDLLKVSTLGEYTTYKANKKDFFLADRIEMTNKLTKKKSILEWSDRKLGLKFNNSQFKSSKLK